MDLYPVEDFVYLHDGYDLTYDPFILPRHVMREAICSQLWVELLKASLDPDGPYEANHAVFKFLFEKPYSGFPGARLEITGSVKSESSSEEEDETTVWKSGYLCVKASRHAGPSQKSISTIQLPIAPNTKVGSIMNALVDGGLSIFDFVRTEPSILYEGCRDFIAQACSVLMQEGIITGRDTIVLYPDINLPSDIYQVLGLRCVNGKFGAVPIVKGRFEFHDRLDEEEIPYEGSPASARTEGLLQIAMPDTPS